jgi:hypothetical protein
LTTLHLHRRLQNQRLNRSRSQLWKRKSLNQIRKMNLNLNQSQSQSLL